MKIFVLLILTVFASEKENDAENNPNFGENRILVKIEEDEYSKVNKKSEYIGVSYDKKLSKWCVRRWSKDENKIVYNGVYDDEQTAACASDTLARKVMDNGERKLKLNFPDDYAEVYQEEKQTSSNYIGVSYNKKHSKWCAQRWNKCENKVVSNGYYDDEEAAAHASDTLARKLMHNGEQKLKLNFPDSYTEVDIDKDKTTTSKYIGVFFHKNRSKWCAQRWCKPEHKMVYNGNYDDEEAAAHASDTLARKLMCNGEQKLKLNFPDDSTEVYPDENRKKKRKRPSSTEQISSNTNEV